MRRRLEKIDGVRARFTGIFVRFGDKGFHPTRGLLRTVLLRMVKDEGGKVVSDHLWLNLTKDLEEAGLSAGCVVAFDARVTPYKKGYWGDPLMACEIGKPPSFDYKLARPTKVQVISRET